MDDIKKNILAGGEGQEKKGENTGVLNHWKSCLGCSASYL
jgi:hypothetical protein